MPTLWEDLRDLRDDIVSDWAEDDPTKEPLPIEGSNHQINPANMVVSVIVSSMNEILARHTRAAGRKWQAQQQKLSEE